MKKETVPLCKSQADWVANLSGQPVSILSAMLKASGHQPKGNKVNKALLLATTLEPHVLSNLLRDHAAHGAPKAKATPMASTKPAPAEGMAIHRDALHEKQPPAKKAKTKRAPVEGMAKAKANAKAKASYSRCPEAEAQEVLTKARPAPVEGVASSTEPARPRGWPTLSSTMMPAPLLKLLEDWTHCHLQQNTAKNSTKHCQFGPHGSTPTVRPRKN